MWTALGRLKTQWDCPPSGIARGSCYTMSANYDDAGNITSLTYPDGHTVATSYNSAGRMTSVKLGAFSYYTVPQTQLAGTWGHWPTGAMNRGTFGNGVIETTGYNNRPYNALGNRVRKDAGSTSTEYFFFGGNIIAELNPVTSAYTDYIFAYGKRIAKDTSGNGSAAQYYHDDQIGSARIMTDASGTKIMDCTFNPFGEQVSCSPDNRRITTGSPAKNSIANRS